eukprot:2002360-Amphidinium_carterae.4
MSLSRGVRQRVGKRRALQMQSNEVIDGLNWLAGKSSSVTEGQIPTETQKQALEFIAHRVEGSPASLESLPHF